MNLPDARPSPLWCSRRIEMQAAKKPAAGTEKLRAPGPTRAEARCQCGDVVVEIAVPAQWAWHDHSAATRRAHGAAYATYVGSWRSRFRFMRGEDCLTR